MPEAGWLYEQELALASVFGQRFDAAGVARVAAPEAPGMPIGNRAMVGPDDGLIPDQLVQIFDAQDREGSARSVEIYGARDDRDVLCAELGLVELGAEVVAVRRAVVGAPVAMGDNRAAPDVEAVAPEAWVEAIEHMRRGALSAGDRAQLMREALHPGTSLFGIRIGAVWVAAVSRIDLPTSSRFSSVYCDPDFRKTGFARACVAASLRSCPRTRSYGVMKATAADVVGLVRSVVPDASGPMPRRRWVAPQEAG